MSKKNSFVVECHDIQGNKQKVSADELYFRPSVYGVLIENKKILLSRQWDGYDFPGGGIEKHETIMDALHREFWEETGLRIEPVGLITCETSFFIMPHDRGATNCQVMYYAVKKVSGELSTANFDEYEKTYAHLPEWIALADIPKIKFYNSVNSVRIIQQAAHKEYAPL